MPQGEATAALAQSTFPGALMTPQELTPAAWLSQHLWQEGCTSPVGTPEIWPEFHQMAAAQKLKLLQKTTSPATN